MASEGVDENIPEGEQGAITGQLGFVTELTMISLGFLVGAWSDRVGRNILFTFGFVLLALGFVGMANVASVPGLYAVRLVLAFGACAVGVMFTSTQTDYPQEPDRGQVRAGAVRGTRCRSTPCAGSASS